MTIFLILAPYGAYATLMLVTSATVSLLAAALICLAVIAFDIARGRSIKILGLGSVIVFTAVGSYLTFVDPTPSTIAVKIAVDAGILLVSFSSILIGHPFTRQYALEQVNAEIARQPGFLYANYLITAAWTAATLLMLIGNIAVLYVPALPLWTGLLIAFAARNAAVCFTRWYPQYRAAKYGTPPAGALPSR
ncbi:intracellular septation protein A [Bradyrhizobium embrapense]